MHVILLLVFLFALYFAPKTTLGVSALFIAAVVYFGFIAHPQGNLSPEYTEKWGLDKRRVSTSDEFDYCGGDIPCVPKKAPETTAPGPTPIKPFPGTARKVY